MKNLSAAKSYQQCVICREWGWDVSRCFENVGLCLPCYVDVLEVRQARGVMGEQRTHPADPESRGSNPTRADATIPGNSPSPYRQGDLFDDGPPRA